MARAQPLLPANCRSINGMPALAKATLADAIMDRLVHNAYKIKLEGDSLRKQQANLTTINEIE